VERWIFAGKLKLQKKGAGRTTAAARLLDKDALLGGAFNSAGRSLSRSAVL
jgi:hypothetical protein